MTDQQILLTGDWEYRDFSALVQLVPDAPRIPVEQAIDYLLTDGRETKIILIAVARPGQISQKSVDALHQAAPLARQVAVLGSWCEGETRTGAPWPGVHRWPWIRSASLLRRILQEEIPVEMWAGPRTATLPETLMGQHAPTKPSASRTFAVAAADWDTAGAIADRCQQLGHATVWIRLQTPRLGVGGIDGVIWDSPDFSTSQQQQLIQLHRQFPNTPLVALINFPRLDDQQCAFDCGATVVLAKPFLLDDLDAALNELQMNKRRHSLPAHRSVDS